MDVGLFVFMQILNLIPLYLQGGIQGWGGALCEVSGHQKLHLKNEICFKDLFPFCTLLISCYPLNINFTIPESVVVPDTKEAVFWIIKGLTKKLAFIWFWGPEHLYLCSLLYYQLFFALYLISMNDIYDCIKCFSFWRLCWFIQAI